MLVSHHLGRIESVVHSVIGVDDGARRQARRSTTVRGDQRRLATGAIAPADSTRVSTLPRS